jgi:hypothetical protein
VKNAFYRGLEGAFKLDGMVSMNPEWLQFDGARNGQDCEAQPPLPEPKETLSFHCSVIISYVNHVQR